MGKWGRPRPINRHASTEAAGYWGPWRSALAPWLRLEANSERDLGPGATVGVLGTGVPRLSCLRPTAWLHQRPYTAHLHQETLKTLARGQASRGGRCKTSSGAASPNRLTRGGEIKARQTSRGPSDVSHDDRDQAGASVQYPCFLFGAKGASAGAKYQGIKQRFPYWCNETKTRRTARRRSPWSPGRRHHQSLWQAKTAFVRTLNIWGEDQGIYK